MWLYQYLLNESGRGKEREREEEKSGKSEHFLEDEGVRPDLVMPGLR